MNYTVLFGTESGTAEMVAEDIAEALGAGTRLCDLQDMDPGSLRSDSLYIIVCSTYGDGELPASAQPFATALQQDRPDLTGVRFSLFGLGDRGYAESFNRGGDALAELLTALGAIRIGEHARHDAAGFEDASETAASWALGLLQLPLAA